jgi:hypothetical protein
VVLAVAAELLWVDKLEETVIVVVVAEEEVPV